MESLKYLPIHVLIMPAKTIGDNPYNAVHQLTKTLEFLSRVDKYIEDAHKTNNAKFEEMWEIIKADREKHAKLLKEFLLTEMKENRF